MISTTLTPGIIFWCETIAAVLAFTALGAALNHYLTARTPRRNKVAVRVQNTPSQNIFERK